MCLAIVKLNSPNNRGAYHQYSIARSNNRFNFSSTCYNHYLCCMKHLYLLFVLLLSQLSSAQLREFYITEREPDGTSIVQANTEYPDNAMILVYSDLKDLDFRSSVGGINQQRYNERANRYEILVNPQRQILFVSCKGFIEQRVSLINPKPKEVFYYQVEERQGQDLLSVVFLVEPYDAKLFINDIPTEINKTVSVPIGLVKIRLERQGFWPIDASVVISENQVNYSYSMNKINPVALKLKANVAGARVEINNQEKGMTDAKGFFNEFLLPGVYQVRLSKSGHLSDEQTIEISEQTSKEISFNLEQNIGILKITSDHDELFVRINKKLQNTKNIELAPGIYLLEISKDGYRDFEEQVEVIRGETYTISVDLQPILGELQFTVIPYDAAVTLKDAYGNVIDRWTGLKFISDLKVGGYTVEVRANGHITQKRSIKIEEDEKTVVKLELKEKKKRNNVEESKQAAEDEIERSLLLSIRPSNLKNPYFLYNNHYGLVYIIKAKDDSPLDFGFYGEFSTTLNFGSADHLMKRDGRIEGLNVDDIIYIHDEESNHRLRSVMFGAGYLISNIYNVFDISFGMGGVIHETQYIASVLRSEESSVVSDVTIGKQMFDFGYVSLGLHFHFGRLHFGANVNFLQKEIISNSVYPESELNIKTQFLVGFTL